MDKVADVKVEIARLEEQLEQSFAKLSTAMENMDKASSVIETQVGQYKKQVEVMDRITVVEEPEQKKNVVVGQPVARPQPQPKKSLTDSVLDTISKLLDK